MVRQSQAVRRRIAHAWHTGSEQRRLVHVHADDGVFGPDSFTYHAYDGLNGGNVATVSLNVGDTTPPVVTNPAAQTSTEGNTVSLQIQATDPDDVTFSYTATGLPWA